MYGLWKSQHCNAGSPSASSMFASIVSRSPRQTDNFCSHWRNGLSAKRVSTKIPTHHQLSTAHRLFHAPKAVSRSKRLRSYITRLLLPAAIASKRFTLFMPAHSQRYVFNVQFRNGLRYIRVLFVGVHSQAGPLSRRSSSRSLSARLLVALPCDMILV